MYNLPDEEFDRICREAADSPEAGIPADGWEQIRERLDRDMPEGKNRRRRWFLWIPFFLSLPLAMLTWKQMPLPARAHAPLESVQDRNIQSTAPSGNFHSPVSPGKTMQESPVFSDAQTAEVSTKEKTPAINTEPLGRSKSHHAFVQNRLPDNVTIKYSPARSKVTGKPSTGPGTASPAPDDTAAHRDLSAPVMAMADDMIHAFDRDTIRQVTDLVAGRPVPYVQDTGAVPARPQPTKNRHAGVQDAGARGFTFSAVFGPDVSNVGSSSPEKAGVNMGLIVGFRFNNRWSVQAGALYSRKHYTITGGDYQAYPGYNPSNPALVMDKVEAHCFMWDFPLNVRYDVIARTKHRFYAIAGLSSYFMNREDLHYYYKYNNTPRYKHWENRSQSMYWFSAFNISVGYAWQCTPRWSASVEPYLKLPVRPVGYSGVDLNSMGLLLGITYRPPWHHVKTTQK
jgi:hypothetical protein